MQEGRVITFDTGALIALERRKQRMREVVERAMATDQRITVPADVVGEWWRGRTDVRERILASVDVESLTEAPAVRRGCLPCRPRTRAADTRPPTTACTMRSCARQERSRHAGPRPRARPA